MSFSFVGIVNKPAKEAHDLVEKTPSPQYVRDYIAAGINGLVIIYGADVSITVNAYGHLCEGKGSSEVTNATIEVRRGE